MIELSSLDYSLMIVFFTIILGLGIYVSKKSRRSSSEFFLSNRSMPWWLLGFSMVATTFAVDTPLLVTDIVRADGVAGNWVWWAFLITGLLTVFVYAKLWRKSEVNTDLEFYELRYSGKAAKFLRGFRAIYLGVIFNVLVMSVVTLAAIKIGGIMLNIEPWKTVLYTGGITLIISTLGGFRGIVYTDFVLFIISMLGALASAYYAVNLTQVGGIENLLTNDLVISKMDIFPDFSNTENLIQLLIIPLALQWWSSWYPGAEPGGGGYIAQRMLSAKNENHAIAATFFFNFIHYALRPWPWILVALASLVVFPNIDSLQAAFPNIPAHKIGHDLAYPAMLRFLPNGIIGVVLASLISAYVSTISTHLNWGASYIVNDFFKRFINKNANEKKLVNIGKISTVFMMIISGIIALSLTNVKQVFDIIIMFGAGTGLIFILRWFWWRINAWSEIAAMFSSGIISIILNFTNLDIFLFDYHLGIFPSWSKLPLVVLTTSTIWLIITFVTKADSNTVLFNFYKKIQPGGIGWKKIRNIAKKENLEIHNSKESWSIPNGILSIIIGCILIYSCLFAIGFWIYGNTGKAVLAMLIAFVSAYMLIRIWKKVKNKIL